MELIKPDLGLLIWMLISFSVVSYILVRFAWKPILKVLKNREKSITQSLSAAKKAKEEMAMIEFGNEKITALAKQERETVLREAKEMKNKIIEEAKQEARQEAAKIIDNAIRNVEREKNKAINEIKNQIAALSIDIAENILKQKLQDKSKQQELVNNLVKNIDLN